VRQQIQRVGPRNCSVLVTGESGVGKELVAQALHKASKRRDGPFITVHCGAISQGLLESELFGHIKGAFSGATENKTGYFQQADYGTVFLDEIGEMPLDAQVKLLRVIEGQPFYPVGSDRTVQVDVRVVAATNRDLEKRVAEGKFREDLFYRLEFPIQVPPLRDRPEDLEALAAHFLGLLEQEYRSELKLTPEALKRMKGYNWPGNLRQLRAVLGLAAAMSNDGLIDAGDLRLPSSSSACEKSLRLEEVEESTIREALRRTNGAIGTASELLGIHRDTLASKMKKYNIKKLGD